MTDVLNAYDDEQQAAMIEALQNIRRDRRYRPEGDKLLSILINDNWAHPHAWFDMWSDQYRNEWRLSEKGGRLLDAREKEVLDERRRLHP